MRTAPAQQPEHQVSGRCPAIGHLEAMAARFGAALDATDLGGVDAAGLDRAITLARSLQAQLDALVVRAGIRADELSEAGVGASARDALVGSGQIRGSTARREAARAGLARRSPLLRHHLGAGRLGPDHLDTLVRRLGPLDDDHLTRTELHHLLERAAELPADTFDAALRRAVEQAAPTVDEPSADPNERARADSALRHWFNHRTGMGHLTAQLDPERYEALVTALDQHVTTLANSGDEARTRDANLAAEALVDLVCSSGERAGHLPHITVIVDHTTLAQGRHPDTIAETGDGHDLSDAALARLCCDAILRKVTLDRHGVPIDVGRRHRTATDAQWAAIRAVHTSCAWAGCDRPLAHCQAHHVHHWEHGGPTNLDNLIPLCPHHHHLVHDGRWHIELKPDRAVSITRPDGHHHTTTSPATRRPPPLHGDRILTTE